MSRRTQFNVAAIVLTGVVGFGIVAGQPQEQDILAVARYQPDAVTLAIESCDQDFSLEEVREVAPGTFEVLITSEETQNSGACQHQLTMPVDEALETITIIDQASGETFEILNNGQPLPLSLNGTWRLTNTMFFDSIDATADGPAPELSISADASSGVITDAAGCSMSFSFQGADNANQPDTITATEEPCAGADSIERTTTLRSIVEVLTNGPAEVSFHNGNLIIEAGNEIAEFAQIAP